MGGSTVVIAPPDGDMALYLESLRRLLVLDPALSTIAPGHGPLLLDPATTITDLVAHRLHREEMVADTLRRAHRATVDELLPTVYADVTNEELLPVARKSLWAHLRKLSDDGRVESSDPDDVDSSWVIPSSDGSGL
jgi:glyoxylase-like metal-dependent hydrolase (beta-lactamase superfamily II)